MGRVLASGKPASKMVFLEKRFEIPDYDNPKEVSRIRWRIIHTPWFGIYLHKWLKPDPRPTLHNHPWNFISFILKGNYMEIGFTETRNFHWVKHIKRVNVVRRSDFHTITFVESGTISLMFVGRTHQDWGYLDGDKYINFDKHPHSEEFKKALKARNDYKK